jgi:hypothetical protein
MIGPVAVMDLGGKSYTPQELATMIFKSMKQACGTQIVTIVHVLAELSLTLINDAQLQMSMSPVRLKRNLRMKKHLNHPR